jgi:hypothetical protein
MSSVEMKKKKKSIEIFRSTLTHLKKDTNGIKLNVESEKVPSEINIMNLNPSLVFAFAIKT